MSKVRETNPHRWYNHLRNLFHLYQYNNFAPWLSHLVLPGKEPVSLQHKQLPYDLWPQWNPLSHHPLLFPPVSVIWQPPDLGQKMPKAEHCSELPGSQSNSAGQRRGQILWVEVNNLHNAVSVIVDQITWNSDFWPNGTSTSAWGAILCGTQYLIIKGAIKCLTEILSFITEHAFYDLMMSAGT